MSASRSTVAAFADWLRAQPDECLTTLLATRPDLVHPVPSDVAALAARACSRASTELALDRLDLGSLQVLEALALLPVPTVSGLATLLDVALAELARPLDALRSCGLVFGNGSAKSDTMRVQPVVADIVPFPGGLGPPARIALTEIPSDQLPSILHDVRSVLGEPPADPDEPGANDVIAALAALFENDATLDRLLAAIPPAPRKVVEALAVGPPIGRIAGARHSVSAATAESPLGWLLAHAILTPLDDYTVVLPREVGLRLRNGRPFESPALRAPSSSGSRLTISTIDATAAGQAFTVVRLIETLLERWGTEPPSMLRAGGLAVRELRRVARELEIDERFAALLIEVAHGAGLLAPEGPAGSAWLPTVSYDRWLTRPISDRWVQLVTVWITTTRVPALINRREPAHLVAPGAPTPPKSTSPPNALGPDVDRALAPTVRRAVLYELAAAAQGHQLTAEIITQRIAWAMPRRGGRLRDDLAEWSAQEAELLGVTGRGALSSFGRALVTIEARDASPDDAPIVEPNGRAAEVLEPLLPSPLDHIVLQGDLTAIAPGPLDSELSRELAILADVESTGGATVYRFSAASITRALDAGFNASDIHALLTQRSRTPVPQPLHYLIDDAARRHGRLRVGSAGCYLRCDDDALLRAVVADRRAESLRLRRIAANVAVSPLATERVTTRLREIGYAPATESADGGVVLRRPDSRRANVHPRPSPFRPAMPMPSPRTLALTVRAIRSGDRAEQIARRATKNAEPVGMDQPPHSASALTLAMLREAVADRRPVWIGYLNAQGQASSRVIEPMRMAGGFVTAFDHRRDEVRSFAVHRITGVASLDDEQSRQLSAQAVNEAVDKADDVDAEARDWVI